LQLRFYLLSPGFTFENFHLDHHHCQFDGQTGAVRHAGKQTDGEKQTKSNNVLSFVLDRVEFHYTKTEERQENITNIRKLSSCYYFCICKLLEFTLNIHSVVFLRHSTDKLCGVCATSNDMKSSSDFVLWHRTSHGRRLATESGGRKNISILCAKILMTFF